MSYDINNYTTRIVDMKTNQTIKTYDNFELLAFSKDNQSIFGNVRHERRDSFKSINLENNKVDIIDKYLVDKV